jgi:long-chain fatty acid transport protein
MTIRFVRTPIATAAIGLCVSLGTASSFGAGFLINENSASGLGNAFAGGAAAAEDATTLWSNVAGMSRIRTRQGVAAIHLVTPSIKFNNEASSQFPGTALGGNGGDAGGVNVVPNFYFVTPIDAQWSVGVGVNALGSGDRLRRRLDRPLPGRQVRHQDRQHQPGGVVARQ